MSIATISRFSLSAYADLRDAGELNKLESKVFEIVAAYGPMTREEIEAESGLRINSVCGRVANMIKKGVLVEVGAERNPVTGKMNGLLDLSLAEVPAPGLSLVADSAVDALDASAIAQAERAA